MKKRPLLSIVIPTYNEGGRISKCIESLKKQSYQDFELFIVDDGSNDNTLEIVKKYKDVKILKQNHKGPGKARNLGAREAKGEILIFVDADMAFDKDYLKYLVKPIIDTDIIGTEEELQYADNLQNIWSKCWGQVRTNPKNKERKIFRAIKRSKFLELGGFDAQYGYADDQTFFFKYGIKSKAAKGSICFHGNPETLKEVYHQSKWIGASIDNFWIKTKILRRFVPFLLALFSPLFIPILSVKRSIRNKNFRVFFPWMLIFMTTRYFGTVKGIYRKVYLGKNAR